MTYPLASRSCACSHDRAIHPSSLYVVTDAFRGRRASRDGAAVLRVVNGDVVTVTASGAASVLAHGAVNASWTR